jgi:DNA-binding NarL/FixJ family response regulator
MFADDHSASVFSRLTGRQRQILDLLCENLSSRQVGVVLGICPRTVDNHCVRICRELGVSDRFEAARLWRKRELTGFAAPRTDRQPPLRAFE